MWTIWGYHVYRRSWNPIQGENLSVIHETGNAYDRHTIATLKECQIVDHLPKEKSRIVRFILLHVAKLSVIVLDDKYRQSPLIQGGLEIPIRVTVVMAYSDINRPKMQKFEDLIKNECTKVQNPCYKDITWMHTPLHKQTQPPYNWTMCGHSFLISLKLWIYGQNSTDSWRTTCYDDWQSKRNKASKIQKLAFQCFMQTSAKAKKFQDGNWSIRLYTTISLQLRSFPKIATIFHQKDSRSFQQWV